MVISPEKRQLTVDQPDRQNLNQIMLIKALAGLGPAKP